MSSKMVAICRECRTEHTVSLKWAAAEGREDSEQTCWSCRHNWTPPTSLPCLACSEAYYEIWE